MAADKSGALYGTASQGSYPHPFGVGTVFKMIGSPFKP
jgi:hypothetical protein